jgi:hypothetical protein
MANAIQLPQRRKALATVRKGVLEAPVRVLIYGTEKVGKSTFAAGSPSPVFIGADLGTARLDVARLEPSSWDEAVGWVEDLAVDAHDYKTIVVDPANWLEPLCWAKVVSTSGDGAKTIEEVGGGYKKGYTAALEHWRTLLFALEKCWRRGMHIVITAHCQVKNFANPEGPAYDRFELAMNPQAAGVLKQWVDAVLFARLETYAKVEKGKARGFSTGARYLHTQPCAAYDAGARWKLPEELPLSWDDFYGAVQAEKGRAEELTKQIVAMSTELGDAEITKLSAAFIEKNKNNADRLAELVNRLGIKIEEKKKDGAK